MHGLFVLASLMLLLLLGVPIAVALGLASVIALLLFGEQSLISVAQSFFNTMEVYPLLAVPFFILAGNLMTGGGMARRLIDFANAATGRLRGGLAMATVLASTLFAAVSGSSPATVVAVGSVSIAGMVAAGYGRGFAAGLVANAGTLGILIPPSIVMVIYGAITDTSVGALFMAGILPGILLAAMMMLVVHVKARIDQVPLQPAPSLRLLAREGGRAFWGLALIVIIMGGIYAGLFTPTEAAAVAAVYAFVVAVFIHRDLKLKQVGGVLVESARLTATLMFIVANAYLFAFVLTTEQIPQSAAAMLLGFDLAPWTFLLAINVILLIAGSFINPSAVVLIMAPIMFPIAVSLGIDPVHFGIVMVVNMEIGMVTPPIGLNLFVASGVSGLNVTEVIRASFPWLALLLAMLALITYVPWLSLVLPRALGLM